MGLWRESFLDFIDVERITGRALGQAILHWLESNGLSAVDLQGQCFDWASNMSGARSGCYSTASSKSSVCSLLVTCKRPHHRSLHRIVYSFKVAIIKLEYSNMLEIQSNLSTPATLGMVRQCEICIQDS